jgi:hypothetical protein
MLPMVLEDIVAPKLHDTIRIKLNEARGAFDANPNIDVACEVLASAMSDLSKLLSKKKHKKAITDQAAVLKEQLLSGRNPEAALRSLNQIIGEKFQSNENAQELKHLYQALREFADRLREFSAAQPAAKSAQTLLQSLGILPGSSSTTRLVDAASSANQPVPDEATAGIKTAITSLAFTDDPESLQPEAIVRLEHLKQWLEYYKDFLPPDASYRDNVPMGDAVAAVNELLIILWQVVPTGHPDIPQELQTLTGAIDIAGDIYALFDGAFGQLLTNRLAGKIEAYLTIYQSKVDQALGALTASALVADQPGDLLTHLGGVLQSYILAQRAIQGEEYDANTDDVITQASEATANFIRPLIQQATASRSEHDLQRLAETLGRANDQGGNSGAYYVYLAIGSIPPDIGRAYNLQATEAPRSPTISLTTTDNKATFARIIQATLQGSEHLAARMLAEQTLESISDEAEREFTGADIISLNLTTLDNTPVTKATESYLQTQLLAAQTPEQAKKIVQVLKPNSFSTATKTTTSAKAMRSFNYFASAQVTVLGKAPLCKNIFCSLSSILRWSKLPSALSITIQWSAETDAVTLPTCRTIADVFISMAEQLDTTPYPDLHQLHALNQAYEQIFIALENIINNALLTQPHPTFVGANDDPEISNYKNILKLLIPEWRKIVKLNAGLPQEEQFNEERFTALFTAGTDYMAAPSVDLLEHLNNASSHLVSGHNPAFPEVTTSPSTSLVSVDDSDTHAPPANGRHSHLSAAS